MLIAKVDVEADRWLRVRFDYSQLALTMMKTVPGATFVGKERGGPHWRVPLALTTARRLREAFGKGLRPDTGARLWARQQVRLEKQQLRRSRIETALLRRVPIVLPELYEFITRPRRGMPRRDYQLADIAIMAAHNCINANEPGLGKTIETIAAIFEAGLDDGPNLIVAPKGSLESVWQFELERWQRHPVLVTSGDDSSAEKQVVMDTAMRWWQQGLPFWLVTNPATVRYVAEVRYDPDQDKGVEVRADPAHPELFTIQWRSKTADEYHKMGLTNPRTLGARALSDLRAERRFLISGTPMGGRPIRLWGGLHYLEPSKFPARWRWAAEWLQVSNNGFGGAIGSVQPGREDEFDAMLAPHMVRRTKREVLPQLPPKQYIDVWVRMARTQREQYERFARDAEIRINEEKLSATSILAEYARLKQFANAVCRLERDAAGVLHLQPTPNSAKLRMLQERLEERGIRREDPEGDEVAIVASESKKMIDMTAAWLRKQGLTVALITGDVSGTERAQIVRDFQRGRYRVVCLTTTAGGVSITLDRANSVHVMDETWNPDDQTQLEDRAHRGSRMHQVDIYRYITRDTIQEYVREVAHGKSITNHNILDLRRVGLRAI